MHEVASNAYLILGFVFLTISLLAFTFHVKDRKTIAAAFLCVLCFCAAKVTSYDPITPTSDDVFYVVDDPGGTPASKKATFSAIEGALNHDNLTGFVANEHIDWTAASENFVTTGTLNAAGAGPHAIGTAVDNRYALMLSSDFTPVGGVSSALVRMNGTLSPLANTPGYGLTIVGTIFNEAASGNHTNFTSLDVSPPTIVAGGATTDLATALYVSGQPTGATNNYSMMVGSGSSRFDGIIQGPDSVDRLDLDISNAGAIHLRGRGDVKIRADADANESGKAIIFEHNSGTTLARLGDDGYLGIGVTATSPLHVSNAADQVADFHCTDATGYVRIRDSVDSSHIVAASSMTSVGGFSSLHANNLNIDNVSGNVGIGTVSPGALLDVNNAIQADNDATAGNTRFLLYDVDNATMERVTVGAADSGGMGFKVLRIPN